MITGREPDNINRELQPCPLAKHFDKPKGVGRKACCMGYRRPRLRQQRKMKRIGHLYEQIISIENLQRADEKARCGKTHTYGVRVHDKNKQANILALHEALLTKTYRTSNYDIFTVYEPKERIIYRLPYYPDRIVHHAIMNVLEPIWVKTFTHNTFSCIKGRGIEGCARYVEKLIRKYDGKPLYCLKIDIKKFYPSIKHRVLKSIIRRKLKDEDLLWLLDEIIDSTDGLPIGNYLSQFLANLLLCYMMHRLNEVYHADCAEYADDIIVLSDSKEKLRTLFFQVIKPIIEGELELTVKGNYQIFPITDNRADCHGRALDYVGYKFYRHQKLIRKSIKQNFCRAVSKLSKRVPPVSPMTFKQGIAPWLGWAAHSNSKNLVKLLIPKEYVSIL